MKLFFRAALIVSLVAVTFVATACNTTKGAGKDIEAAGEGLQNSADRHGAN